MSPNGSVDSPYFFNSKDLFATFKHANACNQSPERFCCTLALNEKIGFNCFLSPITNVLNFVITSSIKFFIVDSKNPIEFFALFPSSAFSTNLYC